jgi:hypothetical protein
MQDKNYQCLDLSFFVLKQEISKYKQRNPYETMVFYLGSWRLFAPSVEHTSIITSAFIDKSNS